MICKICGYDHRQQPPTAQCYQEQVTLLERQRDDLLDVCKNGLKFADSLSRTISHAQQENKEAFQAMLTKAIAKAIPAEPPSNQPDTEP